MKEDEQSSSFFVCIRFIRKILVRFGSLRIRQIRRILFRFGSERNYHNYHNYPRNIFFLLSPAAMWFISHRNHRNLFRYSVLFPFLPL